jgi:outer membrane protein assembly factor BamB
LWIATAGAHAVEADRSWDIFYNGPGNHEDNAQFVAVTPDGGVFVGGRTYAATISDRPFVSRYAESGAERWTRVLPLRVVAEGLEDLTVDQNGDVVFSAGVQSGVERFGGIWKLSGEDGEVMWDHQVEGIGDCVFFSGAGLPLAVGSDDSVILCGCGMTTIKYAADGTELWRHALDTDLDRTFAGDVAVDDEGRVFAVGVRLDDVQSYIVVAYDAQGAPLWDETLVGPIGSVFGNSHLAIDGDGNVIVAGVPESTCGLFSMLLAKFDPAGNLLWRFNYPDAPCTNFDPAGITVLPNGDIVAAGSIGGSADIHVVAFDADGKFLWDDNHDGPMSSSDVAFAITSDSHGNVYTVGEEMLAS